MLPQDALDMTETDVSALIADMPKGKKGEAAAIVLFIAGIKVLNKFSSLSEMIRKIAFLEKEFNEGILDIETLEKSADLLLQVRELFMSAPSVK